MSTGATFGPEDDQVWAQLFQRQSILREQQIFSIFGEGLRSLEIPATHVPDIVQINEKLSARTGFRAVYVRGLEDAGNFFAMLARREFPVGSFIRSAQDLNYTPAPDVFHDLYGHIPFLADPDYAHFSSELGRYASRCAGKPKQLSQWERLYWFGVEFSLLNSRAGRKIFGAGIASSNTECEFSLSDRPDVRPFDLQEIRDRDYRIDELQTTLFALNSPEELYGCLDNFERLLT